MMREQDTRYVLLVANAQSPPSGALPSFTTDRSSSVLGAVCMEDSQDPHLGSNKTTGVESFLASTN